METRHRTLVDENNRIHNEIDKLKADIDTLELRTKITQANIQVTPIKEPITTPPNYNSIPNKESPTKTKNYEFMNNHKFDSEPDNKHP